ncbi:pitrilysin family protein [Geomonas sp.]|uniref:M16 family metallopeptidase n=1 Tax=Geomonas sp. TaxID=2651584 RepID=UPI002B4735EB|nr:pitrilysin family protein [Geomonas sp.]HJV34250.1 pitrilysin family protein [Geomonas sp.]
MISTTHSRTFFTTTLKRLPVLCLLAGLAAGCATTAGGGSEKAPSAKAEAANPRTMVFPQLNFQLPKSDRVTLDNGMVVYLLPDHELPLVHLTAYLKAGSVFEPADKVGLASLTGAAIREGGTRSTPPNKLDQELEFMASAIESSINADHATISASTLSKNLDRTLELFGQVMTEPAFDSARVEMDKNRAIEGIRRQNDDPKGIAARELNSAIYAGHPLGRVPTLTSVRAITRQDMISFHQRYFYPENVIMAVSGDFDKEKLLAGLKKVFAKWPNRQSSFPQVAEPKEDMKHEVLHAQKEVNQSVIRMGHLGIDKNNPDLYAIKVMDFILGGGFTSRLTQEVRSNQGLAYNVDSYFETGRRFPAPFIIETETKSETTARTIALVNSIVDGMTKAEVSDQELKLAKDHIINSFIFSFERSDAVVTQQARLEFYGYPKGYLENFRDNIAKVTKEDVLRVARKYLQPEAMKLVVVGDEKKFDRPLSEFGPVKEIKLVIK